MDAIPLPPLPFLFPSALQESVTMTTKFRIVQACCFLLFVALDVAAAADENLRTRNLGKDDDHRGDWRDLGLVGGYLAAMSLLLASWGVINSLCFVPGLADGVGFGTIEVET